MTISSLIFHGTGCTSVLRFPQGNDLCGTQQSHGFFCLWFSRIFKISHWNACGMDRASTVTWHNPIPPRMFLQTRQNTLAQTVSRRRGLGCATLQPTPEPSHKHFCERFWKFSKTTSKKNRDFVVYQKQMLVGNTTRWSYFAMFSTTRGLTSTWQCCCGVAGFSATICRKYVRRDMSFAIISDACSCPFIRGPSFAPGRTLNLNEWILHEPCVRNFPTRSYVSDQRIRKVQYSEWLGRNLAIQLDNKKSIRKK